MNKNLSPIYDLIRADGSIVINKNLIFSLGMNEAIIYTELIAKQIYFDTRENFTKDGYFYNTVDNLLLDTGIGEKAQYSAIKNLQDFELIEYKIKGMPPKRHFRVVDNPHLLLNYIENGREKRKLLEEKLRQSAGTSKLRLLGGINNSKREELITPNGSVNNTKPNNTKPNNTKERYVTITSDDNVFLNLYDKYFYRQFKKDHMEIKYTSYLEVEAWLLELTSYGIDKEYWSEQVNEHFSFLPKSNNGNILSFMEASKRYFEVDSPKQAEGYY